MECGTVTHYLLIFHSIISNIIYLITLYLHLYICIHLQLLRTNSIQANVFNLEHNKLLLSVDKGWFMPEVMEFLLSRQEVSKVVRDNKDYFPEASSESDL